MKECKLALLGFGNAGQAFAKLLLEKEEEINARFGCGVKVVAIATGSRGTLVDSKGIDLSKARKDMETLGRFDEGTRGLSRLDAMDIVTSVDYDVLAELTPLNIFTGEPAISHITGALKRKKHVITANKGSIAWSYKSLCRLAEQQGVLFLYETTVMDGTPVFNLVKETLQLCKVTEIKGILNSTTNFILEEMAKGRDYDSVLREGKERGFVEADPSMDVQGWDAAAKTAALLNVLMDADITPADIDRKGIEDITAEQIQEASRKGKVIKLLCRGQILENCVKGSVEPLEISKGELLAGISGTSSVVSITTDLMGTVSIVEHDPEIEQTGYGILSDLLRILERTNGLS
jgi:homoserine dehydrogenase